MRCPGPDRVDLFRGLQRAVRRVRGMSQRARSLVDWLLLRAWVEPDHEQPLRVVVKHPDDPAGEPVPEEAFADADGAASFVRGWLQNLVSRWEAGERSAAQPRWAPDDLDAGDGEEG